MRQMVPPGPAVNSGGDEPCPARHGRISGVDGVLQTLARLELGLGRFTDLHRLAGARIAPRRRLAARAGKGAEADQPNLVAALQRARDRVEHSLDGPRSISPAEARHVGDVAD